jgi:hypothetical protein
MKQVIKSIDKIKQVSISGKFYVSAFHNEFENLKSQFATSSWGVDSSEGGNLIPQFALSGWAASRSFFY